MKWERIKNKKRILAVDDAVIILRKITDALEEYFDVITVSSGTRALRYLEREKPDLILLDIRMMPKDGLETLKDIRAMDDRDDIPVILLTGVEDKQFVIEGIRLGICDYILKPFSPEDLLERINRALESNDGNHMPASAAEEF